MLSWKEPAKSALLRLGTQGARHILEVRVSGSELQQSLLAFLAGTSYAVEARDDGVLLVDPPGTLDPTIAEAELGIYLRMWERLTPGANARILG